MAVVLKLTCNAKLCAANAMSNCCATASPQNLLNNNIRQAFGLGVLDPPYHLLFNLYGFTPLSPMVDVWGRNVKDQKVPPAHPDRQLWAWSGWLTLTPLEGFRPHHCSEPLHFTSENHNE